MSTLAITFLFGHFLDPLIQGQDLRTVPVS